MFKFFKKKTDTEIEIENYHSEITCDEIHQLLSANNVLLVVEDVFSLSKLGVVVVGQIRQGEISIGDNVIISDLNGSYKTKTIVSAIESFGKQLTVARVGDNVGLLLSGLTKDDISKGDRIAK